MQNENEPASREIYLGQEVDRILEDPVFARSPIQARLLSFLRDCELQGRQSLGQYEIATEGLGKSEDYDIQNDSYPRVQVSRLRANLANYYARNEPHGEQCVFLPSGTYNLKLASREKAYPDRRKVNRDGTPVGSEAAGEASAIAGTEPAIAASPVRAGRGFPGGAVGMAIAGILATLLVGAIVAALFLRSSPTNREGRQVPQVALEVREEAGFDAEPLTAAVLRSARLQLEDSFVSYLSGNRGTDNADYRVVIDMGLGVELPEANLTLLGNNSETLYTASVPFEGDRAAFLRGISANLVPMVSPGGVIAKTESQFITGAPRSAFECFLVIESRRSTGAATGDSIDDCLAAYPQDRFAAYWHARKAFSGYQGLIAQGIAPDRSQEPWSHIEEALRVDPYNAFANYVAAKVNVAEGNCDGANVLIDRALRRGTTYPALEAATEVEIASCRKNGQEVEGDNHENLRRLVRENPAPDPLMHLYLVLASLSSSDRALAMEAISKREPAASGNQLEEVVAELREALANPASVRGSRAELDRSLALFVWDDRARNRILRELEAGT